MAKFDLAYGFGDNGHGQVLPNDAKVIPSAMAMTFLPQFKRYFCPTFLPPTSLPGEECPTFEPEQGGVGALAAGEDHSLAICHSAAVRGGAVWAWGSNDRGQCGGNQLPDRTPGIVTGISNPRIVSAGGAFSACADNCGRVFAWGANDMGQLGDDTTEDRREPVQVIGLLGIQELSCGKYHSMALTGDGEVWTWGDNRKGQLGHGDMEFRTKPEKVAFRDNVKIRKICAGDEYCLALDNDGWVWAWGTNNHMLTNEQGQIISPTVPAFYFAPTKMDGLPQMKDIAAGSRHRLGITEDGTLYGWGANDNGQLTWTRVMWGPAMLNIEFKVKRIFAIGDMTYVFTGYRWYYWGASLEKEEIRTFKLPRPMSLEWISGRGKHTLMHSYPNITWPP